jgi:thiopeptide-type bacteriocin biosynthesis protein
MILYPLIKKWIKQDIISLWFFVRYRDPDYHIRLRFYLNDTINFKNCVSEIVHNSKNFTYSNIISTISIDTYIRELERYGTNNIVLCEQLFSHDSTTICENLSNTSSFCDVFIYTVNQCASKLENWIPNLDECIRIINSQYEALNKTLKLNNKDLNKLYAKYRNALTIDAKQNLFLYKKGIKPTEDISYPPDIIPSLIHMYINKIFVENHRLYETEIYYFLKRLIEMKKFLLTKQETNYEKENQT